MLDADNIDLMIKIVMVIIMFGIGLSLNQKEFEDIQENKQLLYLGTLSKVLLLPLLGFLFMELTSLRYEWKLGIMILLLCPGATIANLVTLWFDGSTVLTILLTTLSSLLAVVSIPFSLNLINSYYSNQESNLSLPLTETVIGILTIIIVPIAIGFLGKRLHPVFAKKIGAVVKPTSAILLAVVFLIKLLAPESAGGTGITLKETLEIVPFLLTFNIGSILLFFYLFSRLGYSKKDSMTIGINTGLQNSGIAILIGSVFLQNQEFIKPALIYSLFSFWTALLFGYIIHKVYAKENWN